MNDFNYRIRILDNDETFDLSSPIEIKRNDIIKLYTKFIEIKIINVKHFFELKYSHTILEAQFYKDITNVHIYPKRIIKGIPSLALFLDLSITTAKKLVESKSIPFVIKNRSYYFDADEVLYFLKR